MNTNKEVCLLAEISSETSIYLEENWAIYGTGKGAEIVYAALCELSAHFIALYKRTVIHKNLMESLF